MNEKYSYVYQNLSLFEIGYHIRCLPTPRRQLFNILVAATGLTPNSVKMMLCPSKDSYLPSMEARDKIATTLGKPVQELFSADRLCVNSLCNIYKELSSKNIEYIEFIDCLSKGTGVTPKTVRKWLTHQRVPTQKVREEIANILGIPINQLFPDD